MASALEWTRAKPSEFSEGRMARASTPNVMGRGLFVRINRADLKVLALGAMREGGFQACQQAVLGPSTTAQQPGATTPPVLRALADSFFIPVPNNVRIVRPGAGVPAGIAAFSGMWDGTLAQGAGTPEPQIVVFEQITPNPPTVRVFYAWAGRGSPAGWTRLGGTFAGNAIAVEERYVSEQDGPIRKTRQFRIGSSDILWHIWEIATGRGTYNHQVLLRRIKE